MTRLRAAHGELVHALREALVGLAERAAAVVKRMVEPRVEAERRMLSGASRAKRVRLGARSTLRAAAPGDVGIGQLALVCRTLAIARASAMRSLAAGFTA